MSNPLNQFILVPELVIEKIITQSLLFIKSDFKNQINEKNSFLYQLTQLVGIQRLIFFEQAKKLFLCEPDDPKKINVSLGYPDLVKHAVSVSIVNSGSQHSSDNALSVDEQYYDEVEQTESKSSEYYSQYTGNDANIGLGGNNLPEISHSWRQNFGRFYDSTYRVTITTDNYNESLIIFNVIKSTFIALEGTGHFDYLGFINLKINDADIQLNSNVTQKKFQKVIQLNFKYQFRVPGVSKFKYANGIIFKGILKDLEDLSPINNTIQ